MNAWLPGQVAEVRTWQEAGASGALGKQPSDGVGWENAWTFCQPVGDGILFGAVIHIKNSIMQHNSTSVTATEALKTRFIFHIIDAPRESSYVYDHRTLSQILTGQEEGFTTHSEFVLKQGDEVVIEEQTYVVDSIRFRMYGGMLGTTPNLGIDLYGIGEPGPFNVEVVAMLKGKE